MVSCAQQTILTGGAKDNKPPKLVLDSNRIVTNFSENHLLLEFNENIQLIKDKRTFITNPEINNIELIEEKNKIDLVWRDSLSKNTTYSFIFLNAALTLFLFRTSQCKQRSEILLCISITFFAS